MSVLAEHYAIVLVPLGEEWFEYRATSVRLTLDDERVPFIQATVTFALGDGDLLNLDPTESDIPVFLTVGRRFGRVDRIRDLTRKYRGKPIAALTADYLGEYLGDVTSSLFHDYEDDGARRVDEARTYDLWMRAIAVDVASATVTLELASGEALLRDHYRAAISTERVPGADLVAKINQVLATRAQGPLTFIPATSIPTDAQIGDEADWQPGEKAWEVAMRLASVHGLHLWCDEDAVWHLATTRDVAGPAFPLTTSGEDRSVVQAVMRRDRDVDWHNSVMIRYRDDEGNVTYDVAVQTPAYPHQLHVIDKDGKPVAGRAARILQTIAPRGRALTIDAVSTYWWTPGQLVSYVSPLATYQGRAASIRWSIPEDEMTIRMRDVEEVA